ncbi:MAG TPA: YesL family protein [Bacillus sp. (in: firmicutes)]|nr:YesL family protein [Bacillus sp. (in: firmicutes)]
MSGWDRFNQLATWMVKIAYLNILWIVFSIIGLVVFGLFPATVAMFTIVGKWFHGDKDLGIFSCFWNVFRDEFFKANRYALLFLAGGYLLYYDFIFLRLNEGQLVFLYPVFIFLAIAYIITLLYFFIVYVHFDLKFFQSIKQSFLIAAVSPVETLLMVASFFILYWVMRLIPGIIPLFTGSVLTIVITWIGHRAFAKIERKKEIRS